MRNRTLETARKKALRIMDELAGEGTFTLRELKVLLEREIENRLGATNPSAGETAALHGADRIFARVLRPAPKETTT